MKELFFSELRRFRTLAVIAAVLHLMALVLFNQIVDVPQYGRRLHALMGIFYMLVSLAFALYHFGSYRAPGRWAWLMHRPLSPTRIFGAIAGASLVLVLLVVALPLVLTLISTSTVGGRVVDMRHYLAVLHVVLLCFSGWLAGGYVMLNHRRSAAVILILPLAVFFDLGSGLAMLVPELLCVALLAYVLSGVFRTNHAAPPSTAPRIAATALPLLVCFYLVLLWGGSTLYQWSLIMTGQHPISGMAPEPGGYTASVRMAPKARLADGLATIAGSEEGKLLSARLAAASAITTYHADVERFAVRHQSSNAEGLMWGDPGTATIWSFSHDDMRYRGRDMADQSPRGFYGAGGKDSEERFAEVPVEESGYLITPHALYRIGSKGSLEKTLATRGDEQIVMAPDEAAGKDGAAPRYRYVLTNARLLALDPRTNAEQFSVALPAAYSDLGFVDVAEMGADTLVSFTFGKRMAEGVSHASQYLMLAGPGATPRQLAVRPMRHDFGVLFEQRDFWVSPVLDALTDAQEASIADGKIPDVVAPQVERSGTVWIAALAVAILSAAVGSAWMARTGATPRRKLGWIVACLLLGAPALLTLMALQPRTRRVAPAAWPAPSPAPQPA